MQYYNMIFKRQALLNFYSTQVFKRCFFKSLRALLLINNVVIVLHQAPQLLEVQMLIFTKCIIQFQLHPSPTGICRGGASVHCRGRVSWVKLELFDT